MHCSNCGNLLSATDKFCDKCGSTNNINVPKESPEKHGKSKKVLASVGGILAFVIAFALAKGVVSGLFNNSDSTKTVDRVSNYLTQDTGWKEFNSASGNFKVLMPNYPKHETSTQQIPNSSITFTQDTYEAEEGDGTYYLVGLSEYPSDVDTSNPKANLDGTLNGILVSTPGNKLVSSKITSFSSYPALDYEISNTEQNITMHGKAVLVDHKMYIVVFANPASLNKTTEYGKFINSFQLLN